MEKSKVYSYDYDDYEEGNKGADTMVADILADSELPELDEIVIGDWGDAWEDSVNQIIDAIVENKEKFSHIKSLFIGDMDFEQCEVSWIIQGDYTKLWDAMPQLEHLTIKGSTDLVLSEGQIKHDNLKSLTIICGGLPKDVIESIRDAKLPNLEKLMLYIGVENYGFDGTIEDIKELLEKSDFPKLTYLGLTDSEIQDEVAQAVVDSKYKEKLEVLDLSMGSLTDKGVDILCQHIDEFKALKHLDAHYHFISGEGMKKLQALSISVDVEDPQEEDEWNGQVYRYPMLTE